MKTRFIIFALTLIVLFSCQKKGTTLVLISKDSHSNIEHWLKGLDSEISTRVFYDLPRDSMQFFLEKANGIILGGGEDVNPLQYHKPEYDTICETPDNFRDSIETLMIDYALLNKVPLLGICRGQQIMNVVGGGTLIPDIPSFIANSEIAHRFKNDSAHIIIPVKDSWIEKMLTYNTIWVNSHHHQSVDKIAPNFIVSAYAEDSVIESIEINDPSIHPFAIAVQWHPESLNDELSNQIGVLFISKIQ